MEFRSGDALFVCDSDLEVTEWNSAAEQLTGIPASEAIGRRCWHLLCGVDDGGRTICHAGCSSARLAREGWPVAAQDLFIKTRHGRRRMAVSTIATERDGEKVFLHLIREAPAPPPQANGKPAAHSPRLTPRQLEVLELMASGAPAKRIARRLGITEATTRNHIRAILLELGCHSQLEAVAQARRFELV